MLTELHSERQLAAIEAASLPYMSEVARDQTLGKYLPSGSQTARFESLGDALSQIPMRRIAVPKK